mgnify:CR=1 FL=1
MKQCGFFKSLFEKVFLQTLFFLVGIPAVFAVKNQEPAQILYVGSYSDLNVLAHKPQSQGAAKGIYALNLDSRGQLSLIQTIPALNPAVIKIHPKREILYAITENIDKNGSVLLYDILPDGRLNYKQSVAATGKSTCYLGFNQSATKAVLVNYWDSFIDVFALDSAGALEKKVQSFVQHKRDNYRQVQTREDHWVNRQVGPHAHSAHFWQDRVFIPDLGENSIFQYVSKDDGQLQLEAIVELEEGSGPRHMVFHPQLDVAYVTNELSSTVLVAQLDKTELAQTKSRFKPLQYSNTISPKKDQPRNYVSELALSFDAKFLYVSNRGHDTIAVFQVNSQTGTLSKLGEFATGGKFPRHFALSPQGNWLIVANQDSDLMTVFSRDPASGLLSEQVTSFSVPSPNFVKFL